VEDTAILFGNNLSITLNDTDGSERVDRVTISGLPSGASLSWTGSLAGQRVALRQRPLRHYRHGSADPRPAGDLRLHAAARRRQQRQPQRGRAHDRCGRLDGDDHRQPGRSSSPPMRTCRPGSGSASARKTRSSPCRSAVGLADTDGSETIHYVDVTGVPAGATVSWTSALGTVTAITGGSVWKGSTADIQARLLSLRIQPPLHSDQDFTLAVTVQAIESNPTNGEVYDLTEDYQFQRGGERHRRRRLADRDWWHLRYRGRHAVALSASVARWSTADGSETLTFRITGVPTGASLQRGHRPRRRRLVVHAGADRVRHQLHAAGQCLRHLQYDARLDRDRGRERRHRAEFSGHPVTVDAQADAPLVSTSAASGVEDTAILFGDKVSITLADTDGSERVNQATISGLPTGASLSWNGCPGPAASRLRQRSLCDHRHGSADPRPAGDLRLHAAARRRQQRQPQHCRAHDGLRQLDGDHHHQPADRGVGRCRTCRPARLGVGHRGHRHRRADHGRPSPTRTDRRPSSTST
jgi:hypothetical protein